MTLRELLRTHRAEILEFASRHGARNIRVFGSVARGQDDSFGDVDLLVDLDPGKSLLDLGGFLMDVKQILHCSVDVVTEAGLLPRMRDHVLRDAIPL